MESIEQGNKLIAEFCGLKTARNGAYLHQSNFYSAKELLYHSSWDWQIPAWSKVITIFKEWATIGDQSQYQEYIRLLEQYENAVFHNKPEVGQGVLVKAITILNTHSSNTKQK